MIQQAVGYKFFPNKNLIDNDKRDTKNRISFLFGAFMRGNKPPVLLGEDKNFSV